MRLSQPLSLILAATLLIGNVTTFADSLSTTNSYNLSYGTVSTTTSELLYYQDLLRDFFKTASRNYNVKNSQTNVTLLETNNTLYNAEGEKIIDKNGALYSPATGQTLVTADGCILNENGETIIDANGQINTELVEICQSNDILYLKKKGDYRVIYYVEEFKNSTKIVTIPDYEGNGLLIGNNNGYPTLEFYTLTNDGSLGTILEFRPDEKTISYHSADQGWFFTSENGNFLFNSNIGYSSAYSSPTDEITNIYQIITENWFQLPYVSKENSSALNNLHSKILSTNQLIDKNGNFYQFDQQLFIGADDTIYSPDSSVTAMVHADGSIAEGFTCTQIDKNKWKIVDNINQGITITYYNEEKPFYEIEPSLHLLGNSLQLKIYENHIEYQLNNVSHPDLPTNITLFALDRNGNFINWEKYCMFVYLETETKPTKFDPLDLVKFIPNLNNLSPNSTYTLKDSKGRIIIDENNIYDTQKRVKIDSNGDIYVLNPKSTTFEKIFDYSSGTFLGIYSFDSLSQPLIDLKGNFLDNSLTGFNRQTCGPYTIIYYGDSDICIPNTHEYPFLYCYNGSVLLEVWQKPTDNLPFTSYMRLNDIYLGFDEEGALLYQSVGADSWDFKITDKKIKFNDNDTVTHSIKLPNFGTVTSQLLTYQDLLRDFFKATSENYNVKNKQTDVTLLEASSILYNERGKKFIDKSGTIYSPETEQILVNADSCILNENGEIIVDATGQINGELVDVIQENDLLSLCKKDDPSTIYYKEQFENSTKSYFILDSKGNTLKIGTSNNCPVLEFTTVTNDESPSTLIEVKPSEKTITYHSANQDWFFKNENGNFLFNSHTSYLSFPNSTTDKITNIYQIIPSDQFEIPQVSKENKYSLKFLDHGSVYQFHHSTLIDTIGNIYTQSSGDTHQLFIGADKTIYSPGDPSTIVIKPDGSLAEGFSFAQPAVNHWAIVGNGRPITIAYNDTENPFYEIMLDLYGCRLKIYQNHVEYEYRNDKVFPFFELDCNGNFINWNKYCMFTALETEKTTTKFASLNLTKFIPNLNSLVPTAAYTLKDTEDRIIIDKDKNLYDTQNQIKIEASGDIYALNQNNSFEKIFDYSSKSLLAKEYDHYVTLFNLEGISDYSALVKISEPYTVIQSAYLSENNYVCIPDTDEYPFLYCRGDGSVLWEVWQKPKDGHPFTSSMRLNNIYLGFDEEDTLFYQPVDAESWYFKIINGEIKFNENLVTKIDSVVEPDTDGTENPDTDIPDINNPDTNSPGTDIPDTNNPDTNSPGTDIPDTNNPDTNNPDTNNPDTNNPDTNNPDIDTPDINAPNTNIPGTNLPTDEDEEVDNTPDSSETSGNETSSGTSGNTGGGTSNSNSSGSGTSSNGASDSTSSTNGNAPTEAPALNAPSETTSNNNTTATQTPATITSETKKEDIKELTKLQNEVSKATKNVLEKLALALTKPTTNTTPATTTPRPVVTNVGVTLNGKTLNLQDKVLSESGRTMLPVRSIAELLDVEIGYNAQSKVAIVVKGGKTIEFIIGTNTAIINGTEVVQIDPQNPDVKIIAENGRTYLPVRFLAEQFGLTVDYSNETINLISK